MKRHLIMVAVGIIGMILLTSLMFGFKNTFGSIKLFYIPITSGIIAMILYWWVLPKWYKTILLEFPLSCSVHGLFTFVFGVIISCAVNVAVFTFNDKNIDIISYGFKPSFWFILIGFIPSMLIGLTYLFPVHVNSAQQGDIPEPATNADPASPSSPSPAR